MTSARPSENGSVFFIILLAVMMFALLSYAVSQGSRSGASSLNSEQIRIAANEIISYTDSVQKAVQTLRLRGCSDTQLNFFDSKFTAYNNTTAPSDDSCDIFNVAGGRMNFMMPVSAWFNTAQSANNSYGRWIVPRSVCIPGIGTGGNSCNLASEADLVIILPWVKEEICAKINQTITGSSNIPTESGAAYLHYDFFVGTYAAPQNINSFDNYMNGKSALCFRGATADPAGGYHFYRVLQAR